MAVAPKKKPDNDAHNNSDVFWITYGLIVLATIVFVGFSLDGMLGIIEEIEQPDAAYTDTVFAEKLPDQASDGTLAVVAWAALEKDIAENRHTRGESMLATRTWLRFMNASFGAILVMSGAIFFLARVRMPKSEIEAQSANFKIILATASPGLVMVIVGAILLAVPLVAKQTISITDTRAYPAPAGFMAMSGSPANNISPAVRDALNKCREENPGASDVELADCLDETRKEWGK